MEVHEALAVMSGRRLSRDGSASIHVHILEVTTSRCTEHLVWVVNFEYGSVIINYLHVSSSLRSWWSCATLARVSMSWLGDTSSGSTVGQLTVSEPVVWRFAALIVRR